nr:RNA-directed DNA polymerase, eukaryota [Tanacetum cinerariifolium]
MLFASLNRFSSPISRTTLVLRTYGSSVRCMAREEDLDRLIGKLCTLWVGRFHLHANVVRSYVAAVNGTNIPPVINAPFSCSPALMLDDTCVNTDDVSRYVMGKAIDLNSIPNLHIILTKEGFAVVQLSYLDDAIPDFVSDERIVWVDIEGIPLKFWSQATFAKIDKIWGEVMDIEETLGSTFARKRLCIKTSLATNILETFKVIFKGKVYLVRAKELFTWTPCFLEYKKSGYISDDESIRDTNNKPDVSQLGGDALVGESDDEWVSDTIFGDNSSSPCNIECEVNANRDEQQSADPFGFYVLLRKPHTNIGDDTEPSLSHPPGFTPQESSPTVNTKAKSHLQDSHVNETSSGFPTWIHSRTTINGGSILEILDGMINVGNSMGYDMEGCSKDIERIIGLQRATDTLQETKMECISHMDVKSIWGNSIYKFVASGSVGNSSGILCVWEDSIFKKEDVSISDNFIALYGTWLPTNSKVLIVVIYAPQSTVLKRILWDYILGLINIWKGETIVLGDFNVVRFEEERFGSFFNQSCARAFNQFVSSSGLLEVKMKGYSFTWSHPSATKINHRPIILNEIYFAFGPTPFRIYHSWFKRDGFDAMVEQAWRFFTHNDSNGLIRFKKKLQDLTKTIQAWIRDTNKSYVGVKKSISDELVAIDKILDTGAVLDELLANRLDLSHKLHKLNQLDLKEAAQKAKVKWAIEKGENSNFFHGIINKRRIQLAIRGVFHNGDWHTDPNLVKRAFLIILLLGVNNLVALILNLVCRFLTICLLIKWRNWTRALLQIKSVLLFEIVRFYASLTIVSFQEILDGPFILNEVLAWCKHKKKQAIIFKVDFFKAYDSVRWDFLLDVLQAFGFGPSCGLKQGDPLAPLLFILIMESLHISVSRGANDDVFKGLQIQGSLSLSHIFYADDAVFIGEWSDDNLDNLIRILNCFHLASGLKINVNKSQVLGVGVPPDIVNQGASRIGCSVMHLPFKYLGVMVGDHMSRYSAWSSSIQKIRTRFIQVEGQNPFRVLHEMEILRNKFFNGTDVSKSKITWVAWDKVLASKKKGGLGVSSFFALNRALLLKWVWRFLSQDDSVKEVSVAAKFGDPSLDDSFHKQVIDGSERQQWLDLVSMLDAVSLSSSSDSWYCDFNRDGAFRVKEILSTFSLGVIWRSVSFKGFAVGNLQWVDDQSFDDWLSWFKSVRMPGAPSSSTILFRLLLIGVSIVVIVHFLGSSG